MCCVVHTSGTGRQPEVKTMLLHRESSLGPFLAGFGAGVLFAALVDPRRGAARRAVIRDKVLSLVRRAGVGARREARDLSQRAQGTVYEATHAAEDVADDILVERVRAQLGRPVSHPRAVDVRADSGCVTLSGTILRNEVDETIARVARIRGVKSVRNALDVQAAPGSHPKLQ